MSRPSLLGILAKGLRRLRRGDTQPGVQARAPHLSATASPRAYTLDLQRDEVALSRFIKRLSVSGADNIRVEYPNDGIVRISMDRPTAEDIWESTIGELMDRCCLRHAA